jgi:hypothetical protein
MLQSGADEVWFLSATDDKIGRRNKQVLGTEKKGFCHYL